MLPWVLLLFAGCAAKPVAIEQELMRLQRDLAPVAGGTGDPLSLIGLLRTGVERHPAVISARLDEANAGLQRHGLDAQPLPRVSIQPRVVQSPLIADNPGYYGLGAPLNLQWDMLSIWTNQYARMAAVNDERAKAMQVAIARRHAGSELLAAYYGYWISDNRRQAEAIVQTDIALALRLAGAELALGSMAPVDVADLGRRDLSQRVRLSQIDAEAARLTAGLARMLDRPTAPALAPPPLAIDIGPEVADYDVQACRRRSDIDAVDALYLQNARWLERAARLEKWSRLRIDFSLGNLLGWDAAFLETVLSWTLPLLDQGDGSRRELQAELLTLRYLIARKSELTAYADTLHGLKQELAERELALAMLADGHGDATLRGSDMEQVAIERHRRLAEEEARLRRDLARLRLFAFCAPDIDAVIARLEGQR
jgi:hypothetical protein